MRRVVDVVLIIVATVALTYAVLFLIPFMVLYTFVDEEAVLDDRLLIAGISVLSLIPGLFAGSFITRNRSQALITALLTSVVTFVALVVNPLNVLEDAYYPRALLIPPLVAVATAVLLTRRAKTQVERSGEVPPE